MNILHFLKCFLFIIPFFLSLLIEEQWKENQVIIKLKLWQNSSNENSEINNKLNVAKQFFMLNILATVIAWNTFYSFKIPIPGISFLISFLLLSILWGVYLLYIRMKFKYEK